ncbi:hypothetical protein [Pleomorphovibrio marinus]|uniref:hypothetical protein n=1 Tax=Pleomorphovibrio marinus TaxID=2164132 RepID=UPI000E0AD025|nr:hypothetical protein [Pleomorphovibrio marinus]
MLNLGGRIVELAPQTIKALKGFGTADWHKLFASGANEVVGGVYGAHDAFANNPFGGAILSVPEMLGGQMTFNVASKWVGGFNKITAARGGTKLLGTARTNLLSRVQNPKLKNIVNDLYRPGAKVGSGSSMDAFRLEKLTGGTVGGKSHHTKLLNYRTALQRVWGNRANLSPSDRQITKQLLQDIQNALSGY